MDKLWCSTAVLLRVLDCKQHLQVFKVLHWESTSSLGGRLQRRKTWTATLGLFRARLGKLNVQIKCDSYAHTCVGAEHIYIGEWLRWTVLLNLCATGRHSQNMLSWLSDSLSKQPIREKEKTFWLFQSSLNGCVRLSLNSRCVTCSNVQCLSLHPMLLCCRIFKCYANKLPDYGKLEIVRMTDIPQHTD